MASESATTESAQQAILESVQDGIQSTSVDGQQFSEMDIEKRKRVLDALAGDDALAAGPSGLMSTQRAISPHPNQ